MKAIFANINTTCPFAKQVFGDKEGVNLPGDIQSFLDYFLFSVYVSHGLRVITRYVQQAEKIAFFLKGGYAIPHGELFVNVNVNGDVWYGVNAKKVFAGDDSITTTTDQMELTLYEIGPLRFGEAFHPVEPDAIIIDSHFGVMYKNTSIGFNAGDRLIRNEFGLYVPRDNADGGLVVPLNLLGEKWKPDFDYWKVIERQESE